MGSVVQLVWLYQKHKPHKISSFYPIPQCFECGKKPPEAIKFLILEQSNIYCSNCVLKHLGSMKDHKDAGEGE